MTVPSPVAEQDDPILMLLKGMIASAVLILVGLVGYEVYQQVGAVTPIALWFAQTLALIAGYFVLSFAIGYVITVGPSRLKRWL